MVERDDSDYVVRKATCKDLQGVLAWLRYEYEEINGCMSGFWCNRNLIEDGFTSGDLVALVDRVSQEPRAFCLGGLDGGDGITAVHPDWRGRGLGTILFRHRLEQAKQAEAAGLYILCSPEDSIPFWKKCGFQILAARDGSPTYAVLPIEREVALPKDHARSTFRIELFEPDDEEEVAREATITAAEVSEGEWSLAQRFVAYVPTSDVYVRVSKEDRCLSHEKIKRSGSVGVEYRHPFVKIDQITWKGGD